mmetsp:Transcript_13230/g.20650  ORF Transcript_13230/g.20650 Transcript_13230/m.20650 type:complete len:82 (-) Transcript_13230:6-251(-)
MDNQIQEGMFIEGKLNGWGRVIFSTGNCYYGEMRNGEAHGRGEMTLANGNEPKKKKKKGTFVKELKMKGTFVNGQLDDDNV